MLTSLGSGSTASCTALWRSISDSFVSSNSEGLLFLWSPDHGEHGRRLVLLLLLLLHVWGGWEVIIRNMVFVFSLAILFCPSITSSHDESLLADEWCWWGNCHVVEGHCEDHVSWCSVGLASLEMEATLLFNTWVSTTCWTRSIKVSMFEQFLCPSLLMYSLERTLF